MCGGFVGSLLGMNGGGGGAPAPAATPDTPKVDDKAVRDAVDKQRSAEGGAQGRESTMLTGAQGVSIGMEKLQKKKLLGTPTKLGGD
jgi:hypothetical protein